MNKTLKWILIILGIVVVIIGGLSLFGGGDKGLKVSAEKATRRTIIETVTASGNIYPEVEVKISPDISGEVVELNVEEGDSVRKGTVLARIFADIYSLQRDEAASEVNRQQASVANSNAALRALKASLDQAKLSYDRNKQLFDQKIISQSELEQFETTYRSAEANYEAAKENIRSLQAGVTSSQTGLTRANKDLSRTVLAAPMDGVISSLKIKKGERVAGNSFNVGTEMMTVADMSVLEVRVDVGENDIVKVNIGDSADIKVDAYNERKFKGVVTKIAASTTASASLGTTATNDVTNYEVRIRLLKESYSDLANKTFPFRPGMNASADIKTQRKDNVVAVPIMAVNTRIKNSDESVADKKKEQEKNEQEGMDEQPMVGTEQEVVVFTLQPDGTVKKTVVQSGIQDINYIEIISGLKEGEEVITGPYEVVSQKLKTGTKVKVVPKDELFKK